MEKPWYKKWWGILFIIFTFSILVSTIFNHFAPPRKEISKPAPTQKTDTKYLNEIDARLIQYEKILIDHYPTDIMQKTLENDYLKLTFLDMAYSKAGEEDKKKIFARIKALKLKAEPLRREIYAKNLERIFMEKHYTVGIKTIGKNKETLEFKSILVNKTFVYNLTKDNTVLNTAKNFGFKKVVFTNGFGNMWVYDKL